MTSAEFNPLRLIALIVLVAIQPATPAEAGTATDFSSALACYRALGRVRYSTGYPAGFVAVPGFSGSKAGAYLLTDKNVEFVPDELPDSFGFYLEYASDGLEASGPGSETREFGLHAGNDPKLRSQALYYLSRTLQAQMMILIHAAQCKSSKKLDAGSGASIELRKSKMHLTPQEEDRLSVLFVSGLSLLKDPGASYRTPRRGSESGFQALYQRYKAAEKKHRKFIPTPKEFQTLLDFADVPGQGEHMYAEVSSFLRSVRKNADADREKKVESRLRPKLLNALRICQETRGDGKVSGLARRLSEVPDGLTGN